LKEYTHKNIIYKGERGIPVETSEKSFKIEMLK
jgi:hypothetical protein